MNQKPKTEKSTVLLLEVEIEAYKQTMLALHVAHVASVDVFSSLESQAFEGDVNPCFEVVDRLNVVGLAVASIELQLTGAQTQLAQLKAVEI